MSYLQKITKGSVIFWITASYTAKKKKKKKIKSSLFHSLFVDHFDPSTQPELSQAFLSVHSLIFRNRLLKGHPKLFLQCWLDEPALLQIMLRPKLWDGQSINDSTVCFCSVQVSKLCIIITGDGTIPLFYSLYRYHKFEYRPILI